MMTNLPTKRVKAIPQANNFHCFTYNMAAKTAGIDKKRNYVTDTLCIPMRVFTHHTGSSIQCSWAAVNFP